MCPLASLFLYTQSVNVTSCLLSDHDYVLLTSKMKSKIDMLRGPNYWKLNVSIPKLFKLLKIYGIRNWIFFQILMRLGGNMANPVIEKLSFFCLKNFNNM